MGMLDWSEIQAHNTPGSSWLVVNGHVYDFTAFAPSHPGGSAIIHRYAGRDATEPYNQVHAPSLIAATLPSACYLGTADGPDPTAAQIIPSAPANGTRPPLGDLINIYDFESAAKLSFSPKVWAYVNGASNDNITRDLNQEILKRIWLRPAVMRNVSTVDTSTTLFGCKLDLPLFICPTGRVRTAGEGGEVALARAASASGILQCIATPSSYPHAEVFAATRRHALFQLYVDKERAKTEEMLHTASSSGKVKAILVTVDLPVVSKREDDERAKPESALPAATANDKKGAGLARQTGSFIDPALSWDDIPWLRKHTHLPLLIKGIQRWEDAAKAMQAGCEGIVVSNHGGRAADTAQPAIITLLEIHRNCPDVFSALTVLIDGGFRRGSDIVKAICLGASAVGMGRPFLYAVNYGEDGVQHAVERKLAPFSQNKNANKIVLKDEVETAMRLCGIGTLADASPTYINTSPIDHLVQHGPHPYVQQRQKAKL